MTLDELEAIEVRAENNEAHSDVPTLCAVIRKEWVKNAQLRHMLSLITSGLDHTLHFANIYPEQHKALLAYIDNARLILASHDQQQEEMHREA